MGAKLPCTADLSAGKFSATANLRTKILDFEGFDSSRILTSRGEILMFMGNCPQGLGEQVLAGIILVGRLGVRPSRV
jgi:hypothetical protein